jgi:glycosyltransferase involved in cell wall biosynthesis
MACGTPVIATNEGGLPDFVNNEVGALVDPESPDSLAAGVVSTLARVKADPEWGKRIYEYAEGNFSQERMIEELENLYREVAGE